MTRRVRCLAFCGVLFVGHCRAADLDKDKFKGWSTYPLSRWLVQLDIAPALGGRIIAYILGSHNFLWSNDRLRGQVPGPTRLGPQGEWVNWGGSTAAGVHDKSRRG